MRSIAVALTLALLHAPALARAEEEIPQELRDISIEDRVGAQVPLDVPLRDADGKPVRFGGYFEDGKPVLLVLAYYTCPMLCGLMVNGLTDGLKGLKWTAGEQFRVVVVSFDPRDTPRMAREKREGHLADYGREVSPGGFEFLVGAEGDVRRIADAVGFHYKWEETTRQYAHAAGAFALTPKGVVSRTLYGIHYPPDDLRLALLEASEGKLGSAWDRVVLFCYHYDPNARGYVLAATQLMKVGGLVSVAFLAVVLGRLWSRDARRTAAQERGA